MGERGRAFVLRAPHLPGAGAALHRGRGRERRHERTATNPTPCAERYARRARGADRYSCCKPDVWQTVQERQRAMLRLFARAGLADLSRAAPARSRLRQRRQPARAAAPGLRAEHLIGIELLPERFAQARRVLPRGAALIAGRRVAAPTLPTAAQDIVLLSTVFSSLLDDAFQQRLADAMWRWLKPGGGVLWYDFTVDNPRNPDVRGVPLARARAVPAGARARAARHAGAAAGARGVPRAPGALHCVQHGALLRTHVLAWIDKPA